MQPPVQLLDRLRRTTYRDLDRAVGQVACVPRQSEALRLQTGAVPEVNTLHGARDPKAAVDLAHLALLWDRRGRARRSIGMRRDVECSGRVTFRRLGRQTRTHIFPRLEMRLGAGDRCLAAYRSGELEGVTPAVVAAAIAWRASLNSWTGGPLGQPVRHKIPMATASRRNISL